jgi:hypothetical protein
MRHHTDNLRIAAEARGQDEAFPLGLCVAAILGASAMIYWLLFSGAGQVSHLF